MPLLIDGKYGPEALINKTTGQPLGVGTSITVPNDYSATFVDGNLTITGPPSDGIPVTITPPGSAGYTITLPVPAAISELGDIADLARDALTETAANATYAQSDGAGGLEINGVPVQTGGGDGSERLSVVPNAGTAQTLDLAAASVFDLTLRSASCTLTFANPSQTKATFLTVVLRQDATGNRQVTWPGTVVWASDAEPVLSTAPGLIDLFTFVTTDEGMTWFGYAEAAILSPVPPPGSTAPAPPTDVVATPGNTTASVAFTPGGNGGTPVTEYRATSSPGGLAGTGTSSPVVVQGLTNGTAYTFTVTATNAIGTSAPSAPSAPVTPVTPPAPVVASSSTGTSPLGTDTTSVPKPSGLAVGDVMLAHVRVNDNSPVVAPLNWTTLFAGTVDGPIHTFWKRATQADVDATQFVFDSTENARTAIILARITGARVGNPFGEASSNTAGSLTPSITTTDPNNLLVHFAASSDGSTAIAPPAGMTEFAQVTVAVSTGTARVVGSSQVIAAAGATGTRSASRGSGYMIAVRP